MCFLTTQQLSLHPLCISSDNFRSIVKCTKLPKWLVWRLQFRCCHRRVVLRFNRNFLSFTPINFKLHSARALKSSTECSESESRFINKWQLDGGMHAVQSFRLKGLRPQSCLPAILVGNMRTWNVRTFWKFISLLTGSAGWLRCLHLSPEGKRSQFHFRHSVFPLYFYLVMISLSQP